MQPDTELDTWRQQWQTQAEVPLALRQRVERELRMRRLSLVAAVAVTVIFGLGVPVWAIVSRRPDVAVLAAAVWLFIALNWVVSWSLGRGVSKPGAATSTAFLEFSIQSCRRRRRAIAATGALYVAMLAFNLAWVYQATPMPLGAWEFLTSRKIAIAYVITAALGAHGIWNRRKLGRELQNLWTLRRALEGSHGDR